MLRSNRLVAYQSKLDDEPGDTLLVRRAVLRRVPSVDLAFFETELDIALADFEAMRASALFTADLADYIAYLERTIADMTPRFAYTWLDVRENDRKSLRGRTLE